MTNDEARWIRGNMVIGRVIDGGLIDSAAEPMCYRDGAMDGASTLYPDTLGPP